MKQSMKKSFPLALILLAAGFADAARAPEAKADYLANKKANIEARGKVYSPQQWSNHFDRIDANRDGILTAQEQAEFDPAKQADSMVATPASKPPAPVKTQAAKSASNTTPAVTASKAPSRRGTNSSLGIGCSKSARVGRRYYRNKLLLKKAE